VRSTPSFTLSVTITSVREREILQFIAQGLSNAEIAGQLSLAEGAGRNYVSSLLEKLGAAGWCRDARAWAVKGKIPAR